MTIWQGVAIFAAAVVAGMMNSIAGGGTILTFPTLLWMGRDPIMANATSTVALWPGSLGAMYGFRRELEGSRRWMIRLGAPSLAGGLLGAILLLQTPSRVFASLVPFLILFATILFAAQEPIMRALGKADVTIEERPDTEPSRGWWVWAAIFQFLSSVYGGYFGAGNGIVMLAVLGLLGLTDIHRMNGLKNFFAVCINVVASAYFIISGAINWPDAIVMTVGAIVGGYGGAGLARKLGRRAVRRAVVVIGIFITLSLLFRR